MTNPTEIWGIRGEPSGGAGVGGPEPATPDPDGTYADCNPIVPDVPQALPDTQTWVNVAACSAPTTATDEWVLQDDETYYEGSVWRVSKFNLGSTETCVVVTGIRTVELIADGAPGIGTFPATGGASIVCGPYPTCDECSAPCYKITDCLTLSNAYSNNPAYAGVSGFRSVVDGRCKTVAVEGDKSNCCPGTDTDLHPAGTYADCQTCDEAINPNPAVICQDCYISAISQSSASISGGACGACSFGGAIPWNAYLSSSPNQCCWQWAEVVGGIVRALIVCYHADTDDYYAEATYFEPGVANLGWTTTTNVTGLACNKSTGRLEGTISIPFVSGTCGGVSASCTNVVVTL